MTPLRGHFLFLERELSMISIPFSGSKKYSYKPVREIVKNGKYETVIELFGGSSILSVNLFNDGIVKKAISNDFDHFFDLYPEYLDLKDLVVNKLTAAGLVPTSTYRGRKCLVYPDGRREFIDSVVRQGREREIIRDVFRENIDPKFYRYFALGSNFAFSAVSSHKRILLSDFTMFHSNVGTDIQRKYLKILKKIQLEHSDWKDVMKKHKKLFGPKTIIIADPPYIGTYQNQYKGQFTETESILLVQALKQSGCDFIFFNHDPERVSDWMGDCNYSMRLTGNANNSANRHRQDVMVYYSQNQNRLKYEQISFF